MTTDPTAAHHAQILDWLSAALTDPDTHEIRLEQDITSLSALGHWDVYVEKTVYPDVEATAASQADADLLATYDEAFQAKKNVYATPEGDSPKPYDFGGAAPEDDPLACQCWECQDYALQEKYLKAVTEAIDRYVDRVLKDHTEVPPAFRPAESLKMKGGGSVKSYLEKRYGQPDPATWYRNTGYLQPGQKVTNDDVEPFRLTTKDQWEKILARGVEWKTTDYGQKLTATFTGKAAEDLLVALYGFTGEDETGVAYRVDTPEGIRKAREDLFRTEDDR